GSNGFNSQMVLKNGAVGIGTSTPAGTLDIAESGGFELYFSGTGGANIYSPSDDLYFLTGTNGLHFGTNGANDQMILKSGNVGIGTAIPVAKLHVEGAGLNAYFLAGGVGGGPGIALGSSAGL